MRPEFDDRDREILIQRQAAFDARRGARVGDFVEFACGTTRRISHHWGDSVQTSDGGSWYLGKEGTSFSGSLYQSVPIESLSLTDETRDGAVWFFHHDLWGAGRGVYTLAKFRVFKCTEGAPQ